MTWRWRRAKITVGKNISCHWRTKWSRSGRGGNEHMTILRVQIDINTYKLLYRMWLMSGGSSLSSLSTPPSPSPPTYSPETSHSRSRSRSPVRSPRALETEWSECESPIVEINGIWSTGYKEWQSLDSKWAKRVVRTWVGLVVRKGMEGEREMERWRKGIRPLAVCSRTKCWIMRSDWHDPASELRETVLPLSHSIFWSHCLSHSFSFCLSL